MSISRISDRTPTLIKALPLLALTACGANTNEAALDEVRAEIKGMSIGSAMSRLEGNFEASCAALGDENSNRLDMDAIVTVRDEIGGELLSPEASEWMCHYYRSNDCDFRGSECNSIQDRRPYVDTQWNLTPGTEDLLNKLTVEDPQEVRTQVKEAYDATAALDRDLAAEFKKECEEGKQVLTPITARRTAMLEEQGFEPQKWYCREKYSDEYKADMDTELVAKPGKYEER